MIRLICYDITENKVRTRLSKFLEAQDFFRLQYSVFVGQIEPSRWKNLERTLQKFFNQYCEETDRINSHVIEKDHFEEMLILGHDLDKAWILHEIDVWFV